MIKLYPAIFHEENNVFWSEFPDLEGCQTSATSLEELFKNSAEALGLYLISLIENNKPLPSASNISDISIKEGFATLVDTDIDLYRKNTKSVKKTLSLPYWLNQEAEKAQINFSQTLQEALKEKLIFSI